MRRGKRRRRRKMENYDWEKMWKKISLRAKEEARTIEINTLNFSKFNPFNSRRNGYSVDFIRYSLIAAQPAGIS